MAAPTLSNAVVSGYYEESIGAFCPCSAARADNRLRGRRRLTESVIVRRQASGSGWNRDGGLVSVPPSQFRGLPWLGPTLVDVSGLRIEKALCVWEQLPGSQ